VNPDNLPVAIIIYLGTLSYMLNPRLVFTGQ